MTPKNPEAVEELKTWPTPFEALWNGSKTHEVRKNDRNFQMTDLLVLREWTETGGYTGRTCFAVPTYITYGPNWGLPPDMVVMSVRVTAKHRNWSPS